MLSYTLLNMAVKPATAEENVSDTEEDKNKKMNMQAGVSLGAIVLALIFLVWAIVRALKCTKNKKELRGLHVFFAVTDPVMYLVFSYFLSGMC